MANIDRANGFTPIGSLSGNMTGWVRECAIASDYGTALFVGDVVVFAGSADTEGRPTIEKYADGGKPFGIIVGFTPKPESGLDQVHSPASEAGVAQVNIDPGCLFVGQINGEVAATDIGCNTKISVVAGSTATGRSLSEFSYDDIATTNTLPVRLFGLQRIPNNDFGADAKLVATWNIHALRNDTGATGV